MGNTKAACCLKETRQEMKKGFHGDEEKIICAGCLCLRFCNAYRSVVCFGGSGRFNSFVTI